MDNKAYFTGRSAEAIATRKLILANVDNPAYTFVRVCKFLKRGWSIDNEELLKLMILVSCVDFTKTSEVREVFPLFSSIDVKTVTEAALALNDNRLNKKALEEFNDVNLYGPGKAFGKS